MLISIKGGIVKGLAYASNGKRDLHKLEQEFDNSMEELKKAKWKHNNNKNKIITYLQDCQIGMIKSGGVNKRVSKGTLYRILGILRLLSEEWLNKDFDKATQKDWDAFYRGMETGIIINSKGQPFKQSTRAKNYKSIRKFLKWAYGDGINYPKICSEWVTAEGTITKEALTRNEVRRLINGTNSIKLKTLIIMLFDGGFRIEETANIRWKDLKLTDKGYFKVHIRQETSKTKRERFVTLPLCTDEIKTYKAYLQGRKEYSNDGYLFTNSYGVTYNSIRALGKRVLNKKISPHTFRHSSATHYADIIRTFQQFCTRYGWSLNSNEAQRYYHTVDDDLITESIEENEIANYKNELEKMQIKHERLETTMQEVNKVIFRMDRDYQKMFSVFAEVGSIAKSLPKKHRELLEKPLRKLI